jgi:DNA-binding LytR/AlgR family response regulator
MRILVVEDELIVARQIERALTKFGYQVVGTASSGEDALRIAGESEIDLVMQDINIEGEKNGIDVAKIIRTQYGIPVIFITALSDTATLAKAKVAEPYGYIVKPFEDDDLRAAVEMAHYKSSKDHESMMQRLKLSQAFSGLEEALIMVDSNYNVEFINDTATILSGKILKKKDGDVHINKVVEFYTLQKEKLSVSYFLNQSSEITREKAIVIFPYLDEEAVLYVKSQRMLLNDVVVGWALILSKTESANDGDDAKTISPAYQPLAAPIISCIFAKKGKRYVRISLADILWLEAIDNYVIIHALKEEFVLYITLKELEEKLPSDDFLRIHRSYIIRLDKVSYLEESHVTIHDKVLPVSRNFKKVLKQKAFFV